MRDAVAPFASTQAAIVGIGTVETIVETRRARRVAAAIGVVTAILPKVVPIIVMPNTHDARVAVLSAWGIIVPKS